MSHVNIIVYASRMFDAIIEDLENDNIKGAYERAERAANSLDTHLKYERDQLIHLTERE
jgi:translation initiation factor 2B subunit (eIF-2B alpha/beta/delta family)